MSEQELLPEALEYFLSQARRVAEYNANLMYPNECQAKQEYIERKIKLIYNAKVGNPFEKSVGNSSV